MDQAYRNPTPTVDIIIRLHSRSRHEVVVIERLNPPLGWALPGGFIDEGESAEHAAIREANEETGLHVTLRGLLGVYSDPERDPRKHTMTTVFIADAEGQPHAQDDAKNLVVAHLMDLPQPLCFDHGQILEDYRRFLASGLPHPQPWRV